MASGSIFLENLQNKAEIFLRFSYFFGDITLPFCFVYAFLKCTLKSMVNWTEFCFIIMFYLTFSVTLNMLRCTQDSTQRISCKYIKVQAKFLNMTRKSRLEIFLAFWWFWGSFSYKSFSYKKTTCIRFLSIRANDSV